MIYAAWAFLANIMHAFLPDRRATVEKGYIPLFEVLEEYKEMHCELFFSGVTSEWLSGHYPELTGLIRRGMETGKYRLGSCSYAMPRTPSLSMESTIRQVREGLNVDQKVWGRRGRGFWPPMYSLDPALVKVSSDEGLKWLFMADYNIRALCDAAPYYPSVDELDLFLPFRVRGLGDASMVGVPCGSTGNFRMFEDSGRLHGAIEKIRSRKREHPPLLVLDIDAEVCHANEYCGVTDDTADSLRRVIETLLEMEELELISVDEYLDLCPVRQELFSLPETSHFPRTSEKIIKLSEEAERLLMEVERAVEAVGNSDEKAADELAEAWRFLLVSQNADARCLEGDAGISWKSNPALVKKCMDAALEARSRGEAILRRLSSKNRQF